MNSLDQQSNKYKSDKGNETQRSTKVGNVTEDTMENYIKIKGNKMGRITRNRKRVRYILIMLIIANLLGSQSVVTMAASIENEQVTQSDILLKRLITYAEITDKSKRLSSNYNLLLADITEPKVYGVSNISSRIYMSELAELMTTLVILKHTDLEDTVTISKEAVSITGENTKKFGFVEGDQITVKDLLTCYILTNSDDARVALVEHVAKDEKSFVGMMNELNKQLRTTNTVYTNSKGVYSKKQYSLTHDIYLTLYALLQEEGYTSIMTKKEQTISYISNGDTVSKVCKSESIEDDKNINLPEGYSLVFNITNGNVKRGFNQITLVKDDKEHYYISFVNGPKNVSVSEVSQGLFAILEGKEYKEVLESTTIEVPKKEVPKKEESQKEESKKEESQNQGKGNKDKKELVIKEEWDVPITSNNARYQYLLGTNYKAYTISNPPKGYESVTSAATNMTTITVPVWNIGITGKKYTSKQTFLINKLLAKSVEHIFNEIYALDIKFPIKELVGYTYRKVGGVGLSKSTLMSVHAFGAAIDINPGNDDNDYFLGAGNDLRDRTNPYCIPDEVISIFEKYGWYWGGNFSICSDTMHFQYLGLDFLTYQGNSPFRELKIQTPNEMSGVDVKNLQQRLKKLGFSVKIDGVYGNTTKSAIEKAQKKYKLPVTGIVDYKTWETIINLTHDMSYVF